MTTIEATFAIEDDRARTGFLAWASRHLPAGTALVQVRDIRGRRRAFRTQPASPRAMLVATESPLLLRGSLTQVTRYYVVPQDDLSADEIHYEGEQETHRYVVELAVTCRGVAAKRVPA